MTSRFVASRARDLGGRQQVAAVCYRISNQGPEFLLVRTRGGRWIFPKGGVEPGLSHAQSAALEAFEEAGVHGRIEQMPFARYHHQTSNDEPHQPARRTKHKPVIAHLCEVSRLERPQEPKRKPTWFSPEKAKKRLLKDRDPEFGDQLAAVVDRAVSRIERLGNGVLESRKEELQQANLESREARLAAGSAALIRYFFHAGNAPTAESMDMRRKTRDVASARKIWPIELIRPFEKIPLRLTAGGLAAEDGGSTAKTANNRARPTKRTRD